MGNNFGYYFENAYNLRYHPDVTPSPVEEPCFDPNYGFPNGRKVRTIRTTKEEMESAKIPLEDRDYCVDYLMEFRSCRQKKFPFVVRCSHEKHEYLNCQYRDYVLRMKEYEREKRLRTRAMKLQAAAA